MSIFDPPNLGNNASDFERVDVSIFELPIDEDGRVYIPPELRSRMLADRAGPLIAEIVDGELRLISPKAAMRKAKRLIAEQDWGTDSARLSAHIRATGRGARRVRGMLPADIRVVGYIRFVDTNTT